MKNKQILVTGGAGFIGSHIVDMLLKQGYQVVVLDNCLVGNKLSRRTLAQIKFIEADIRDPQKVMLAVKGCRAIIHLAAIVGVDEVIAQATDMMETETIGTCNIARAAQKYGVKKILYASSSAVYHDVIDQISTEKSPLKLVNSYALAKHLNEKYLEAFSTEYNISISCLRFFNVYGGRQDERMVVPRFFQQALSNQPMVIYGTGRQTRDFTHIDDVNQAILVLLGHKKGGGVFNIARGKDVSILDLAKTIKRVTLSKAPIQLVQFPRQRITYRVDRRVGSSDKLFQQTGFRPLINLEQGLEKCYRNLMQQLTSQQK